MIASCVSCVIKPLLMFGLASLYFGSVLGAIFSGASEQIVAATVLGAATPCAMFGFAWNKLAKGDPNYAFAQIALNNLLFLVAFVPVATLLFGSGGVFLLDLQLLTIAEYTIIPLAAGALTRKIVIRKKGDEYLNQTWIPKFDGIATAAFMLVIVFYFAFFNTLINDPVFTLIATVPLILQKIVMMALALLIFKKLKLPYSAAAPAALIGASNFYDFSVASLIYGSGQNMSFIFAVGRIVEVPAMLFMVWLVSRVKGWYTGLPSKRE